MKIVLWPNPKRLRYEWNFNFPSENTPLVSPRTQVSIRVMGLPFYTQCSQLKGRRCSFILFQVEPIIIQFPPTVTVKAHQRHTVVNANLV